MKKQKTTVRTKDELTKSFRIEKAVRQGYVLNPTLFNLYIANIDKALKNRGIGGIVLLKKILCTEKTKVLIFNR